VPLRGRHAWTGLVSGVVLTLLISTSLVASYLPADTVVPDSATSVTPAPTRVPKGVALAAPVKWAGPASSPTATEPPGTPLPTATPPPEVAQVIATTSPGAINPDPGSAVMQNLEYHVPILMYHRIAPASVSGQAPNSLLMEPELFAAQMGALSAAGWHTITLGELARDIAEGTAPPARTFVITIDDGWWDGYSYAWPIIRDYGFDATYFVISGRIDQSGFLTSAQLRELQAAGNEIGNHTDRHVSLQSVNLATAKAEVDRASDKIALITGQRPMSLAYPMGGTNSVARRAVNECEGLEIAVTTRWGVTESWATRFATPRVRVNPTTQPDRLVAELTQWVGAMDSPIPPGEKSPRPGPNRQTVAS
jgi:peptidoglycan/xylan/chitin deacetylase (PgdA/CDA1 family)